MPKFVTVLSLVLLATLACSRSTKYIAAPVQQATRPTPTVSGWWLAEGFPVEQSYLMGIGKTFQFYDLSARLACNGTEHRMQLLGGRVFVDANGSCFQRVFPAKNDNGRLVTTDLRVNGGRTYQTLTWRRVSHGEAIRIYNAYSSRHPVASAAPSSEVSLGTRVTRRFQPLDHKLAVKLSPTNASFSKASADPESLSKAWPAIKQRLLIQNNRIVERARDLEVGNYCAITSRTELGYVPSEGAIYEIASSKSSPFRDRVGLSMTAHLISLASEAFDIACVTFTSKMYTGDLMDQVGDFVEIYEKKD